MKIRIASVRLAGFSRSSTIPAHNSKEPNSSYDARAGHPVSDAPSTIAGNRKDVISKHTAPPTIRYQDTIENAQRSAAGFVHTGFRPELRPNERRVEVIKPECAKERQNRVEAENRNLHPGHEGGRDAVSGGSATNAVANPAFPPMKASITLNVRIDQRDHLLSRKSPMPVVIPHTANAASIANVASKMPFRNGGAPGGGVWNAANSVQCGEQKQCRPQNRNYTGEGYSRRAFYSHRCIDRRGSLSQYRARICNFSAKKKEYER